MMRLHALFAALALVGAGCYAPALRDCTVACSGADDCAGDQVCGPHGLCVGEGTTCNAAAADAGSPPASITLRVLIDGIGQVRVADIGVCSRTADEPVDELTDGDCAWSVPRAALSLEAIELDEERPFDGWTTILCASEDPRCTFTPASATTIGARFQ